MTFGKAVLLPVLLVIGCGLSPQEEGREAARQQLAADAVEDAWLAAQEARCRALPTNRNRLDIALCVHGSTPGTAYAGNSVVGNIVLYRTGLAASVVNGVMTDAQADKEDAAFIAEERAKRLSTVGRAAEAVAQARENARISAALMLMGGAMMNQGQSRSAFTPAPAPTPLTTSCQRFGSQVICRSY